MPGLRIHHPTLRSCTLLVPHPGNDKGRAAKNYHINLDHEGYAIVSETVWKRLIEAREAGLSPHELLIVNVVDNPPTVRVGGRSHRQRVYYQAPNGVSDAGLLALAQQFAPQGVRARITTKGSP